jgi:hypothetical protein
MRIYPAYTHHLRDSGILEVQELDDLLLPLEEGRGSLVGAGVRRRR